MNHKKSLQSQKQIDMRNEEPFYERLRREDNARNEHKKNASIKMRADMAHAASFSKKGNCILNTSNFEDLAIIDQLKADEIQRNLNM